MYMNMSFPSSAMQDKVFSVTEINNYIKEILEGCLPQLTIEGEISNYRPNSSGHIYFTLKDQTNQISAVMFKSAAYYLDFKPQDGKKVRCTGKISVYGPQGKYQLVITKMQIAGEGDILKMLEERKRRLFNEGLFDESKKKPLPQYPQTIGVITSPNGAALRDILQITKRRNSTVSVIILPAVVQGADAAQSIVNQIRIANEFDLCDVLIVGRGGGSLEDLLPFSEEIVIRAIASSKIPTISAVGHEIDWALSDYAADRRAPTPSAAAELVVPLLSDIKAGLNQYKTEFYNTIKTVTEKYRLMIKTFDPKNLELQFRNIELPFLTRFDNAKTALFQNITQKIQDTRQTIQNSITVLENCSPSTVLKRGYAMVREKDSKKIITSATNQLINKQIEIIPSTGKILATVTNIEEQ